MLSNIAKSMKEDVEEIIEKALDIYFKEYIDQ